MINAEKSDVFDVLAYIAFALPPITRLDRVQERRVTIIRATSPNCRLSLISF